MCTFYLDNPRFGIDLDNVTRQKNNCSGIFFTPTDTKRKFCHSFPIKILHDLFCQFRTATNKIKLFLTFINFYNASPYFTPLTLTYFQYLLFDSRTDAFDECLLVFFTCFNSFLTVF